MEHTETVNLVVKGMPNQIGVAASVAVCWKVRSLPRVTDEEFVMELVRQAFCAIDRGWQHDGEPCSSLFAGMQMTTGATLEWGKDLG
jgi:hypothetical protein